MALTSAAVILFLLWNSGAFLPRWISWENSAGYDASGKYRLILSKKSVSVAYEDNIIWTSPDGVKVQKALSCDADNDGQDELVLLCWKKGRFGKARPIWVEQDERSWSQHIFVYEYTSDEVKPKWLSSYIGQDVLDLASNQKSAPYSRLWLTDLEGSVSSWVWDSWGFTMEDTDISFVAFGDLLAHEPIYRYGLNNGGDFDFLFENVKDVIADSDVAIINQETPLTNQPSMYSDYPRFGTPVQVGEAIVNADFDVVTCATNHALDRGAEGVSFTKTFFDNNGVTCLGIQSEEEEEYQPYQIITRNGIRFAMLNYTYGTNGLPIPDENPYMVHLLDNEEKIRGDIAEAKNAADFVIVFAHWGTEYIEEPDDFQKKWTQVFLDSGVDILIGTHPHILQPYEVLTDDSGHGMLVYYSLGNFISAQPEKSCVKGGMATFTVSLTSVGYSITEYDLIPLSITWQEGKYTVDFVR
ncbi:MAG: CapA family protein [Lachnospiraceae bacterium]|nr:CapA family protein [Lachnospiraceae bacterium]